MLLFGAILTGCGGGGGSAALPPIGSLAPANGKEVPLSTAAFGDSIGVNLHLIFGKSPYVQQFSMWSPVLKASGIRHARDGICPSFFDPVFCNTVAPPAFTDLASAGIRFDLVTSLRDSFSYTQQYPVNVSIETAVEAYEGPNECDSSPDCPSNWQSIEAARQQQLYTLKSRGVTIIAPSMTSGSGYSALGNLAAYADFGNIHDYPAANPPESETATPLHLQWAVTMTANDPVWCTEDGYNTDPTYANNGVPQVVQERYLPRLLFEHLRLGIGRTYIYQLFDYGNDGGSNMGLLNADYTPKPAWKRLLQLMHQFADSRAAPRTPLTYTITGDAKGTLDHLLFQRSGGSYMLALWLAEPVYDPSSHATLAIASETVHVNLPASTSTATLTAYGDNGSVTTTALTGSSNGVFQVPVRSVVSVLEFRP